MPQSRFPSSGVPTLLEMVRGDEKITERKNVRGLGKGHRSSHVHFAWQPKRKGNDGRENT